MSIKTRNEKDAFRIMDKANQGDRTGKEANEELREKGDEHSDVIREKAKEAREVIDSQNFAGRKGRKGGNSHQ